MYCTIRVFGVTSVLIYLKLHIQVAVKRGYDISSRGRITRPSSRLESCSRQHSRAPVQSTASYPTMTTLGPVHAAPESVFVAGARWRTAREMLYEALAELHRTRVQDFLLRPDALLDAQVLTSPSALSSAAAFSYRSCADTRRMPSSGAHDLFSVGLLVPGPDIDELATGVHVQSFAPAANDAKQIFRRTDSIWHLVVNRRMRSCISISVDDDSRLVELLYTVTGLHGRRTQVLMTLRRDAFKAALRTGAVDFDAMQRAICLCLTSEIAGEVEERQQVRSLVPRQEDTVMRGENFAFRGGLHTGDFYCRAMISKFYEGVPVFAAPLFSYGSRVYGVQYNVVQGLKDWGMRDLLSRMIPTLQAPLSSALQTNVQHACSDMRALVASSTEPSLRPSCSSAAAVVDPFGEMPNVSAIPFGDTDIDLTTAQDIDLTTAQDIDLSALSRHSSNLDSVQTFETTSTDSFDVVLGLQPSALNTLASLTPANPLPTSTTPTHIPVSLSAAEQAHLPPDPFSNPESTAHPPSYLQVSSRIPTVDSRTSTKALVEKARNLLATTAPSTLNAMQSTVPPSCAPISIPLLAPMTARKPARYAPPIRRKQRNVVLGKHVAAKLCAAQRIAPASAKPDGEMTFAERKDKEWQEKMERKRIRNREAAARSNAKKSALRKQSKGGEAV